MLLLIISFRQKCFLRTKHCSNKLSYLYNFFSYTIFFILFEKIKVITDITKLVSSSCSINAVFFIKSLLKVLKQKKCIFPSFFLFYQNLFLQQLLVLPTQTKNINIISVLPRELLCVVMFNLKHIRWWRYEVKYGNQLVELLLVSIQLKNLNLVISWIKNYFEKRALKKHKKLFIFLKFLFLNLIWKFQLKFGIRGIRVYLKGKIGKAGSVRKSKKLLQKGRISYTTKSLAMISEKTIIRTMTGTMGLTLEFFF